MRSRKWLAAALPLCAVFLAATAHGLTIETVSSTNEFPFSPFGENSVATVGQSFAADPFMRIDSFSFWLDGIASTDVPLEFTAHIMEWNSGTASANGGSVLWSSGVESLDHTGAFQQFTWMPNLSLPAGTQYMAFISTSGNFDADATNERLGRVDMRYGDPYGDGQFYFLNNFNDPSHWTAATWQSLTSDYDMAFEMEFDTTGTPPPPVPEPATISLLGIGIAGLLFRRHRHSW